MGDHSNIQWTDATWNPTTGCTRVSAGCDHCYAFQIHDQRHAAYLQGTKLPPQYAKPFSKVQLIPERLSLPLRWTKPRRIFVDSMSDLFHADVPNDYLVRVFAAMAAAPQHQFQVLTKRPQRMHRFVTEAANNLEAIRVQMNELEFDLMRPLTETVPQWPLPNVWLGTSVENQAAAYRIDWLVKTPAAVRFLSCEPLLGPVDLAPYLCQHWSHNGCADAEGFWECMQCGQRHRDVPDERGSITVLELLPGTPRSEYRVRREMVSRGRTIDWVIAGGESGPDFRPLDLDWARGLRDQCVAAGVPYFHKQNGGRTAKAGGRELDGRTWDEMPQVLQAA